MRIYIRQTFVALHDVRPGNYGQNLFYDGIDTGYERFTLEVGNGDPGQPPQFDTFDYAEFRLGAAFRVRPADFTQQGTYQTETGMVTYQRYVAVTVPDNFVPPDLFDPDRDPIPDGSGWVDVVTDAMAFAATARGISDTIVGQIFSAADLFQILNSHMRQQLRSIEDVLDGSMTPDDFDAAMTRRAIQLRAELLEHLDPTLGQVIDALDYGFTFDRGWNLPIAMNRAWADEFLEFVSQAPVSDRHIVLSGAAIDGYAVNASRFLIHGGGGNDAFVHQGTPGNRHADPSSPTFSLADVSLFFGGTGYDLLTATNATRIDLTTGWLWVGDGTVTPKVDAFLHGIESLVLGQFAEHVSGSAAGNVIWAEGGNDTVFGQGGGDAVQGQTGADYLSGQTGNDTLTGGAGHDRLVGGLGIDRLTGGTARDRFIFSSLSSCGDVITDFRAADDTIVVAAAAFGGGLLAGGLAPMQFRTRADNLAQDSDDRFIFRSTDQTLWYDANGSATGGLRLIADLQPGSTMTAAEILLS